MNTETLVERFILDEVLLGNGRAKIDPEEDLITNSILDSLALMRLVLFLEERFGVAVADGELLPDNFRTINRITAFVDGKKQPA